MAASRTYFARTSYRFLPTDQIVKTANDHPVIFELDESDVWNSEELRSQSPDSRSRMRRKTSSAAAAARERTAGAPASLPVNVPDWSKILKHEYREHRRKDECCDSDDGENRIPPHEYLARARIASLSVQEGAGRTLKGRDLSRVRNAIWQKTGFED